MPFIQKYLDVLSNFSYNIKGIILLVTGKSVLKRYFTALDREVNGSLVLAAGTEPAHA